MQRVSHGCENVKAQRKHNLVDEEQMVRTDTDIKQWWRNCQKVPFAKLGVRLFECWTLERLTLKHPSAGQTGSEWTASAQRATVYLGQQEVGLRETLSTGLPSLKLCTVLSLQHVELSFRNFRPFCNVVNITLWGLMHSSPFYCFPHSFNSVWKFILSHIIFMFFKTLVLCGSSSKFAFVSKYFCLF